MQPQPVRYTNLELKAMPREDLEDMILQKQMAIFNLIEEANKAEVQTPNGKREGLELTIVQLKRLGFFVIPQEIMGQWSDALSEALYPRVPYYIEAEHTMLFNAYRAVHKVIASMIKSLEEYTGSQPPADDVPF